jgi:hypothetical protein
MIFNVYVFETLYVDIVPYYLDNRGNSRANTC